MMKYPNGYFNTKECRWCHSIFQPIAPSHHYCCDDCKVNGLRNKYYIRTYGISLEEFNELLRRQGGVCAICRGEGFKISDFHYGPFAVDHNHDTGKIRGLLCHQCNQGLGLFKDNLNNLLMAVEYLRKGSETIRKEYNSSELEAHSSSKEDDDIVRS